ncbi:calcium-binding protein [Aliigemmobacter aestuarii]|uniref:Calcium-binding protein n=1 Tax=Aliigemmobacter aestuarii TaxID=1445661 RepID=A0A4S3MPZ0_9RHOB|nr:calcium-binding protein [Gemmobacter aestuarii]THD84489.1 calcium-binding protein [Gemmobacter aestuarii]
MDPIYATYMMLFLGVFALDVGLFDSSQTAEEDGAGDDTGPGGSGDGNDTVDGGDGDGDGDDTVDGGDGDGNDTVDGGEDDSSVEPGGSDLYDPDAYSREVLGTNDDDTLSAEEEMDLAFFLGRGDDVLEGSAGGDYAEGGEGDDVIRMREGNDIVLGGDGNDLIDAGTGFDIALGEEGHDTILGNGGGDRLFGGAGNDLLEGGSEADEIYGGDGEDTIVGLSSGLSTQANGSTIDGVDSLFGGAGNDVLLLGPGDIAVGGEGDDLFQIDQTRIDLADVARIEDYTAGDRLEIHYTPSFDGNGDEEPVVLNIVPNGDNSGNLILMNGRTIANVIGSEALTIGDLVLVRG